MLNKPCVKEARFFKGTPSEEARRTDSVGYVQDISISRLPMAAVSVFMQQEYVLLPISAAMPGRSPQRKTRKEIGS